MQPRQIDVDQSGYFADSGEDLSLAERRPSNPRGPLSSCRANRRALSSRRGACRRHVIARHEEGACSSFESSADESVGCTRSSKDARALSARRLPPSRVVPEPEVGSGSDAGVLPSSRISLRNRRRATVLLCDSLDPSGNPAPCVDFHKFFPITSGYTRRLKVPAADLAHEPCRAPTEFLSVNLRKRFIKPGSLSVEHGQANWRFKRTSAPWKDVSVFEDEDVCDTFSDDIRSEVEDGEPVKFEETDEEVKGSRASGHRAVAAADDPLLLPSEDLFAALFEKAKEDPLAALRGKMKSDKLSPKVEEMAEGMAAEDVENLKKEDLVAKHAHGEDGSGVATVSPTNFEDELRASLVFCGAENQLHIDKSGRPSLVVSWPKTRTKAKVSGFGEFEHHTKQFGFRMLEKMGFTGRLGARSQGIAEPVESQPADGRQGLGSMSAGGSVSAGARANAAKRESPVAAAEERAAADAFEAVITKFGEKGCGSSSASRKRSRNDFSASAGREGSMEDAFSARRRRLHETATNAARQRETPQYPVAEPRGATDVDANSEHETIHSGSEDDFDNGRRGVLVDFDAFVRGSRERRFRAFLSALNSVAGIRQGFDLSHALFRDQLDLGDEEATRHIFALNDLEVSDEAVDAFMGRLDAAFDELEVAKVNTLLLEHLKGISQSCHIGILHRGSRARLNRELHEMGLASGFLSNAPKVALEVSDSRPYLSSVKELMCRLGITSRQSLILSSDHGMQPSTSFIVAGRVLGAKTLVCVDTSDSLFSHSRLLADAGSHGLFDADFYLRDGTYSNGEDSIASLLEILQPRCRRRRVLSLYSREGLWYAGRELYRCRVAGCRDRKVLVRYYRWENEEWVDPSNVEGLTRRDYRRLRDARFEGVMDPTDVADLT